MWWAQRSLQSGQVHSCSRLATRSHFRVWKLIVSIWVWFSRRRVAPLRVLCTPSPALTPFSLRRDRLQGFRRAFYSDIFKLLFDALQNRGWVEGQVVVASMAALPARVSDRSLPDTPARPGLNTQVSFSRALSYRAFIQSTYIYSFLTFCSVLIESITITAFFILCSCRYLL